jgi:hypothetical protein
MCRIKHKRDCLATAAIEPTVLLLSFYLIILPVFLIVASILDIKRAIQNLYIEVTGIESNLSFCSKRHLQS